MSMGVDFIDSGATVREEFDWKTKFLGNTSATIVNSVWSVAPSGPVLSNFIIDSTAGVASCDVSGVADGGIYELENAITLATGEVERRSITIRGGSQ